MHPLATIVQIDRLLKEGQLSQRKIAARLGVSRGTVAAIANGRRGLYGHEPAEDELEPHAPPERCPRCGFRVYLPCLVCRARDCREQRNALRTVFLRRRSRRAAPKACHSASTRHHGRRAARVA